MNPGKVVAKMGSSSGAPLAVAVSKLEAPEAGNARHGVIASTADRILGPQAVKDVDPCAMERHVDAIVSKAEFVDQRRAEG